jgi:hypothetical protein
MTHTRRHAKGRVHTTRTAHMRRRTWRAPRLTDEERAFVQGEIDRGLMAHEVVRMFFRKFGRDVSKSTVYHMMKGDDNAEVQ